MNTRSTRYVLLAALLVVFSGVVFRLHDSSSDRTFRGKPESQWIQGLTYSDYAQVREWREFGPDGVQVLIRGLARAIHPFERAYRKLYRKLTPITGGRFLPDFHMDLTRGTRMTICDLLSHLGPDAIAALPTMLREINDEDPAVRAIAINYFTWPEDQTAVLNQMDTAAKQKLLRVFISNMQDGDASVRNNSANALRYYPQQAEIVAPVLIKALQDSNPRVAMVASNSLQRIDPQAAAKAGLK